MAEQPDLPIDLLPVFAQLAPLQPLPDWFTLGSTTPVVWGRRVLIGLHPTGAELGAVTCPEQLCRGCAFATKQGRFWKCERDRRTWTSGLASDIRLRWRSCARFVAK